MNTTIQSVINTVGDIIADFGLKLLAVIAIWVGGFWLVRKVIASLRYTMTRHDVEPSLTSFSLSFLNVTLKFFVIVIILTTLGVQMTSIVAVLGAASLAIGMALSGTLQNVAGGVVILLFKPFRVGDTIVTADGRTGIVKEIMIFTTQLHTFDNQVLYLPNGALSNSIITNLSRGQNRRTDLTVAISYGDNLENARKIALKILNDDKRVLKDPKPVILLSSLDDSSVTLMIRYWTKYEDLWPVRADVLETIYKEFPKNKLHFPFPQMDVHIAK